MKSRPGDVVLRDDVFDWTCDALQARRIEAGILNGIRVHEGKVEAGDIWIWVPRDHHVVKS